MRAWAGAASARATLRQTAACDRVVPTPEARQPRRHGSRRAPGCETPRRELACASPPSLSAAQRVEADQHVVRNVHVERAQVEEVIRIVVSVETTRDEPGNPPLPRSAIFSRRAKAWAARRWVASALSFHSFCWRASSSRATFGSNALSPPNPIGIGQSLWASE